MHLVLCPPPLIFDEDGGIDHLHRRVTTSGQRIHDPVPNASLPPTFSP